MTLKKGSMREVFAGFHRILRLDEELMSLLVLSPDELNDEYRKPIIPLPLIEDENGELDVSFDDDTYWNRVDHHIKMAQKSSNIEEDAMARLYIYPGRRRATYGNFLLSKQEAVIDILLHDSFADDMRLHWIIDRINELLALEHVQGSIGVVDFVQGNDWVAPIGYVKYQLMYVFGANKK